MDKKERGVVRMYQNNFGLLCCSNNLPLSMHKLVILIQTLVIEKASIVVDTDNNTMIVSDVDWFLYRNFNLKFRP